MTDITAPSAAATAPEACSGAAIENPLRCRSAFGPGRPRLDLQTFSALRHRDFRYLWIGIFFMGAGQWVQQLTLGWLIYDMTGSAVLLGALNGLRTLPFLVSAPSAGVAADRMDRRTLLLNTQVLLSITALLMAILVVTGMVQVWHLFLFTLITGIGWAFNQPVRQALVPALVPKEDLSNAIALGSMGLNITKAIAPMAGGLLIAWFGAGGNFFVQAAAYLLVLIMVYQIRLEPPPTRVHQSSAFADLKDGLQYVGSNRLMLALIVCSLVPQVFAMPYQILMPIFQKDVLGVGPEGLGMLMAAPGVGAVASMLLYASVDHRLRRKGPILLGALILLGICLILFSQATSLPLAIMALLAVGGCQIIFMTTAMTMLQTLAPDALRGRVLSIYMLDRGLQPAGAFLAGVTTSFVGAPLTIAMMGLIVILLAVLVGWRVPHLRKVET